MEHQPLEFTSEIVVKKLDGAGTDIDIVSAARVDDNIPEEWNDLKDDALLDMLMEKRHGTPFEHAFMKFYVEAPIFVSREHFRHRIGHGYNEFSTRYKRLGSKANPMRVYLPPLEDFRTQVGTPGNYTFEPTKRSLAVLSRFNMKGAAEYAYGTYTHMLSNGLAKEMARNVLPLSTMTSYVWSTNPRALMHFLSLRNESNALLEIQKVAQQAELLFQEQFSRTHEAFVRHGRRAP